MRLDEALEAALSARYALPGRSVGREPAKPVTDPEGLRARMDRIMRKFRPAKGRPSVRRQAATAVGVPYSTWNHALSGRRVSKRTLAKISEAFTKLVTAPARALRVKKVGYPGDWLITAFVVCDPGDPEESPEDNRGGSRYVNGHGSGVSRNEIEGLDPAEDPGYRTFKAEGLDSQAIVDVWLASGAGAAADALLEEIADVYGQEFGFEGNDVEVGFDD